MGLLDLLVLAKDLIYDKHQDEAEHGEVDDVVSAAIFAIPFVVCQSVAHPVDHTNQVHEEGKELSL